MVINSLNRELQRISRVTIGEALMNYRAVYSISSYTTYSFIKSLPAWP
jgi:hypothetical protein